MSRRRLIVDLEDKRTLVVPLSLIPGFDLLPPRAFSALELRGSGVAIYFPAIDEWVGVENLLHPEGTMRPKNPPRLIDRRVRPVHARPG